MFETKSTDVGRRVTTRESFDAEAESREESEELAEIAPLSFSDGKQY
jgi:hypothetical protein